MHRWWHGAHGCGYAARPSWLAAAIWYIQADSTIVQSLRYLNPKRSDQRMPKQPTTHNLGADHHQYHHCPGFCTPPRLSLGQLNMCSRGQHSCFTVAVSSRLAPLIDVRALNMACSLQVADTAHACCGIQVSQLPPPDPIPKALCYTETTVSRVEGPPLRPSSLQPPCPCTKQ
jgi:hypothetical protein